MSDYGLIGASLGYSYSKRIHESIFRQFGRSDLTYDLIEQSSLRLLHGYKGFNITIPYKEAVIAQLERVDAEAARMRSVNTVVCSDEGRIGYNTDRAGLIALLPHGLAAYRSAVILGTGASSRMAADVLQERGIRSIVRVSRTAPEVSQDEIWDYDILKDRVRRGMLKPAVLVNATPVGTRGNPAPYLITVETVAAFDAVIDLVYNPAITPLIEMAQASGAYFASGLDMLIVQAIEAQILWGTIPEAAWEGDRASFIQALTRRIRAELESAQSVEVR